ncbi:hypothetical protein BSKO_10705 [Bryopsis sp. KO-2023]|nr:hypothetical protein BSKO_10705 [Bryopsis sp. KO-2023]
MVFGEPMEVMREASDGSLISTHVSVIQSGNEQGLIIIPEEGTKSVECDDRAPEGATCSELEGFGGCTMPVILSNGICRKTCGECSPPPKLIDPSSKTPAVEFNEEKTSEEISGGDVNPDVSHHPDGGNAGSNPTKTGAREKSAKPGALGKGVENGEEQANEKSAPAEGANHEEGGAQIDPIKQDQDSKEANGVGDNLKVIEVTPVEEKPEEAKSSKTEGKGKNQSDIGSKNKGGNEGPASDSSSDTAEDKSEKNSEVPANEQALMSDTGTGGETGLADESDPSEECRSIMQILDDREDLSFMSQLFKATQNPLLKTVGDRSFIGTLFAPTNDAFDKALGEFGSTREAFLTKNPGLVEVVLDAHVVPGLPRTQLSDGQEFPTVTARFDIFVKSDGKGGVQIVSQGDRAAKILGANIEACESVVHVIDNVLFPQPEEVVKQMVEAKSSRPAAG